MKILKFRAWDKEKKEMVTNFFLHGKAIVFYDKLYHIGEYGYELTPYYDGALIDKFSVMQFTGLLDKNGKDIYEGDIITYPNMSYDPSNGDSPVEIKEVYWDYTSWMLDSDNLSEYAAEDLEIIGNIYENPELIKNK